MKFLSLNGLTEYTTKLLNNIKAMLDEKADKDHVHDKTEQMYSYTIDLSDSKYNQDTYYPVIGEPLTKNGFVRIKLSVQLNSGTRPTWSTHETGFSCNLDLLALSSGWGSTKAESIVLDHSYSWADNNPCGYQQLNCSSRPVLWLRGGGKYFVWSEYNADWDIKTSEYTELEDTVSPTTTYTWLNFNKATILANLYGDADTIDGYHADSFAKLNGAQFTGTVTIQSGDLNGNYNGLLIGDDCYIGDCNNSNTIGLMGATNNDIAYIKFGKNGGSLGYNGSYLVYNNSTVVTENTGKAKASSNSDMLNGYRSYDFCHTAFASSTNMNEVTTSGAYRIGSGNTNAPSGADWGQLFVVHGGGDTIAQLIFDYQKGRCWLRTGNPSDCGGAGAWTEWRALYTSENITYGTNALTPGSSSLATGSFYYQYE